MTEVKIVSSRIIALELVVNENIYEVSVYRPQRGRSYKEKSAFYYELNAAGKGQK